MLQGVRIDPVCKTDQSDPDRLSKRWRFSEAESKICNMLENYSLMVQLNSFAMFFPILTQLCKATVQ